MLASADATPRVYQSYLAHDAEVAGVKTPSIDEMGRRLVSRLDESRHPLSPGDAPIEVAGLRLSVLVEKDDLVLVIENPGEVDLAYSIVTKPSYGNSLCAQRRVRPFNAMVVGHESAEKRVECAYRDGLVLAVERVETVALNPLESSYVSRVSPTAVGIETRLAQGHQPRLPVGVDICNLSMSQTIRSSLENGVIGWRDLVDFYARHRCESYGFPEGYRAFSKDAERPLPVVSSGG
ncbi:MAG: hypothetical protein K8W52_27360 [Deltaproteobacteria bacterium]|nr:hypothetical protein [Deltaproteobacteria bacterium]